MNRSVAIMLLFAAGSASADERILSFHSDIRISADGWIDVTESIVVRAEGNRIRRGIYRDQHTEYVDPYGNDYEAAIEPQTVFRNDAAEDFHTVRIDRGIRTYFGSSDRYIPSGEHRYRYRYRANRMLGYFDTHDELYWTVTGFDWAFPIDTASARVSFAFDVPADAIRHEAYTGPFGSKDGDYRSGIADDGSVWFEANAPLSPVNGLTIVVGWPKGLVAEPTGLTKSGWLIRDNTNLLVTLGGLVLLFLYYVPVWNSHGKDPDEGLLVTRYEPPAGFSPASLRYIDQMYYDNKVMTAAIVSLAVKGYLTIEDRGGEHRLERADPGADPPPLAAGERELHDALFAAGDTIQLVNSNHRILGKAKSAHRNSLQADYRHKYFQTNAYLNLPGIAIVLGSTVAALNVGRGPTPFVLAAIVLMFLTMVFFAIIMKRPTLRGRKLLDEMLGFRDYLEVAEKDELNLRNPPEKTPQLFERYLPFALALGVDQAWAEKFAAVLASVRDADGGSYRPAWYHGSWNASSLGSSTKALSTGLSSAVSSSVQAPGSSSGGGGGGSSGGGGGGGGGGGW